MVGRQDPQVKTTSTAKVNDSEFSSLLTEELLEQVNRPGQYLGNEWGAARKDFEQATVRLALSFPDLYELGMSNFGLKILYQIVNATEGLLVDRSYAPGSDLEKILRDRKIPLWGWESRRPLRDFELVGFSLQYELCYTNVLNMLDLAQVPVLAADRTDIFPLIFGGGPSAVNPEPMALFMDFFIIGDGEAAIPNTMKIVREFKERYPDAQGACYRQRLLSELATRVEGLYVPSLYQYNNDGKAPKPVDLKTLQPSQNCSVDHEHCSTADIATPLPERILRQTIPLSNDNQPTASLVPYLSLVHDREVLEVRRGCDRGCRFCQPGYTFLPVRERSTEDLLKLSSQALANSGHQEYSMLSLCVSDYTSLHESVRALNQEHAAKRSSLSFPSQRADRMNLELAEELKAVRKSGITLAPEAGSERLRAIINKGLSHQQIISAIEAAYQSGWTSVKLYFMCGLPLEEDSDLAGIVDILKEATMHCRAIKKTDPVKYKKDIDFTCTISNFVPKPFTPFQWFGQVTPEETERRHKVLRQKLRESGLRNVQLNLTDTTISLLESVISRGDRNVSKMIYEAWKDGAVFDAWDEHFKPQIWHNVAARMNTTLIDMACTDRPVGSEQPWEAIHIGLNNWWLVKEWEKAVAAVETAPCTENLCHACGVCTELDTTHQLSAPKPEVMKKNPFVKELAVKVEESNGDSHPSLFFTKPPEAPVNEALQRIRFKFTKKGDLRFISHLDLQHLLARASRRAVLNVAYTKGFNPAPRLNLAAPLALFQESECEVGEVDLSVVVSTDDFIKRFNAQLPPEIQMLEAREIPVSNMALASILSSATYRVRLVRFADANAERTELEAYRAALNELIQSLLAKEEVFLQSPDADQAGGSSSQKLAQKGSTENAAPNVAKRKNIRPGILSIELVDPSTGTLELELAHGPAMHVKPDHVLKCLQPDDKPFPEAVWRITRTQLKGRGETPLFNT
ncbi:MAG: TIGR03960 family B12-binding radical SAM protein [Candidatus Melainabacteria bacterium]|nr:MAG: TIGR03960 family B12-binding radical SAM protein [Candidatus Melainabacteria bacterium]